MKKGKEKEGGVRDLTVLPHGEGATTTVTCDVRREKEEEGKKESLGLGLALLLTGAPSPGEATPNGSNGSWHDGGLPPSKLL